MKNLLTNPQPSQSDYINAIVKLGSRVYEAATVTPLQKMGKLSDRLHNNIWIKREDRQPVNSFKLRGAYAMISSCFCGQSCARRSIISETTWAKSIDRYATKHAKH